MWEDSVKSVLNLKKNESFTVSKQGAKAFTDNDLADWQKKKILSKEVDHTDICHIMKE